MALYCPGPGMSLARLRPVGKRGAVEKTVHSELAFFDSNCGPNERVCRDRSALPVSIPKQHLGWALIKPVSNNKRNP
jgi:hypothetical protein